VTEGKLFSAENSETSTEAIEDVFRHLFQEGIFPPRRLPPAAARPPSPCTEVGEGARIMMGGGLRAIGTFRITEVPIRGFGVSPGKAPGARRGTPKLRTY
jgi:hypothetical protein